MEGFCKRKALPEGFSKSRAFHQNFSWLFINKEQCYLFQGTCRPTALHLQACHTTKPLDGHSGQHVITAKCSSDYLWWNNEHDHRRMIIITAVFKIMSIAIMIITATVDEYSFLRRSTQSAQNWNQRETPYWFGNLR